MRFSNPSKNDFLHSRARFRTPKSRRIEFFGSFLAPPWILRGPQNHLKSAKWHQNGLIKTLPRRSWHQPASKTLPETPPGTILVDFWLIFDWFLIDFSRILVTFLQQHLQNANAASHETEWRKTSRTRGYLQKYAKVKRTQKRRHQNRGQEIASYRMQTAATNADLQNRGRRCSRR